MNNKKVVRMNGFNEELVYDCVKDGKDFIYGRHSGIALNNGDNRAEYLKRIKEMTEYPIDELFERDMLDEKAEVVYVILSYNVPVMWKVYYHDKRMSGIIVTNKIYTPTTTRFTNKLYGLFNDIYDMFDTVKEAQGYTDEQMDNLYGPQYKEMREYATKKVTVKEMREEMRGGSK